jgi:hypothetical protein
MTDYELFQVYSEKAWHYQALSYAARAGYQRGSDNPGNLWKNKVNQSHPLRALMLNATLELQVGLNITEIQKHISDYSESAPALPPLAEPPIVQQQLNLSKLEHNIQTISGLRAADAYNRLHGMLDQNLQQMIGEGIFGNIDVRNGAENPNVPGPPPNPGLTVFDPIPTPSLNDGADLVNFDSPRGHDVAEIPRNKQQVYDLARLPNDDPNPDDHDDLNQFKVKKDHPTTGVEWAR